MNLQELEASHVQDGRRRELFDRLVEQIDVWNEEFSGLEVWLFGSFLTDKPEPGDIDILVTAPLAGNGFKKPTKLYPDDLQVLFQLSHRPKTKEKMVEILNRKNQSLDFSLSVDDLVELTID